MLRQLIDYFIHTALTHKAVKYARYQKRVYTNAQNSNAYLQFNFDTDGYLQYMKTTNVLQLTVNADILGLPLKEWTVLDCQNLAMQVALEFIQHIKDDESYKGLMQVDDFSILCLDEFTDDKSAGVRLTLELVIPYFVDKCSFEENFNEDNVPVEEIDEIDLTDANAPSKIDDLVLKPLLLPQKK